MTNSEEFNQRTGKLRFQPYTKQEKKKKTVSWRSLQHQAMCSKHTHTYTSQGNNIHVCVPGPQALVSQEKYFLK